MVELEGCSAPLPAAGSHPLVVAVPGLHGFQEQSGIGRVWQSLRAVWGERVRLVDAAFTRWDLPLLRNIPRGVRPDAAADLILLPQLTGAAGLRQTGGTPGIVMVHDVGIVDFPGDRAAMNWFGRYAVQRSFHGLRYASHIIAVSHFTRNRLIAHMPELEGRISVVPNGVGQTFLNYEQSQATARQRVAEQFGLTLDAPLLINVGSELPRKNMPLLLQTFKQLKMRHPEARLIRVGSPGHPRWRAQTLRAAARLGLAVGRDLWLLGPVADDEKLADLYRAADVYLTTSLYEGFGLPALEAMAVGVPVVAARCSALPEVIGAAGWLAAPAPGALAAATEAALTGAQRDARVQAGRQRAAALSWAQAAEGYLDIMQQWCSRS